MVYNRYQRWNIPSGKTQLPFQMFRCSHVPFTFVSKPIFWKRFLNGKQPPFTHPRRSRGSQSGRKKRRDESFQVWTKEPLGTILGTDSHRTISKNSSGCRLLIGQKKCFVLLCPIGEQFLLSSFREFVVLSRHTCPVRSPSLCEQEKLLFYTFLTKTNELPMSRKKMSSFREFVVLSRHTCPVRSPSLCEQGKLLFYSFLTKTNELPMSRKNVWDAISRSSSICPENILVLTYHNRAIYTRKNKTRLT